MYGKKCEIYTRHKCSSTFSRRKELNMCQMRWLELIKDYDYEILYHSGKANVVADALSRKERLEMIMSSKELKEISRKWE